MTKLGKKSKKKEEIEEEIVEDELTECKKRNVELEARIEKLEEET